MPESEAAEILTDARGGDPGPIQHEPPWRVAKKD
jgi:hypothetical protein